MTRRLLESKVVRLGQNLAPPEKKAAGAAGNRFVRNVRFAAKHEVMGTARLGAKQTGALG
jgi:hypothetical protein